MAEEKTQKGINLDSVASLAKLKLAENERAKLEDDMRSVIAFAEKLEKTATDNVSAREHIVDFANVFREDEPKSEYTRQELLSNAVTKTEEYICVPRVVE